MEVLEPRRPRTNTICGLYTLHGMLLLVNILTVVCVVLVAVTLTKVSKESDKPAIPTTTESPERSGPQTALTEQELRQKFPGYFRTPEEQKQIEELYNSTGGYKNVSVGHVSYNSTCSIQCPKEAAGDRGLIPIHFFESYHGCCHSWVTFDSPPWMKDIQGKNRTMAVFGQLRQYFQKDNCEQVPNCWDCLCEQNDSFVSGVYVVNGTEATYSVAFFRRPGCCKCMNM